MDHEQVLALALDLPPEQRAALAERLIESLDLPGDDVEAAWTEGIRRRLARLDSGEARTIPWPEARQRISAGGRLPQRTSARSESRDTPGRP